MGDDSSDERAEEEEDWELVELLRGEWVEGFRDEGDGCAARVWSWRKLEASILRRGGCGGDGDVGMVM